MLIVVSFKKSEKSLYDKTIKEVGEYGDKSAFVKQVLAGYFKEREGVQNE